MLGAVLLLAALGKAVHSFGGLEFGVDVGFADVGVTELSVPPVGRVRARTHLTPVKLRISLESVDLDLLRRMFGSAESAAGLTRDFMRSWRRFAVAFAARLVGLGALGGALGIHLAGDPRSLRRIARGALIGALLAALLLGGTYASYDLSAFRHPQYSGAIAAAPWMVDFSVEALSRLDRVGRQVGEIASHLYTAFRGISELSDVGRLPGAIRVLHVSDIHNNPAAVSLLRQVVREFGVHFVIDTGDITDFGTPVEAELLRGLGELGVPYLVAVGNHESPEVLERLERTPHVVVLDGRVKTVEGIRVLGIGDPASLSGSVELLPDPWYAEYAATLGQALADAEGGVDIIAVHSPRLALSFAGRVPVILHGHTHSPRVREEAGTVIIDGGTTGAAGFRGLQAAEEIPATLAVIHFAGEERPRPIAVDTISVFFRRASFTVTRMVVGEEERAPAP